MLSLDNCRSPQIAGLTDEFVNLEVLSMIQAGLTSLKGFPSLPHLKRVKKEEVTEIKKLLLKEPRRF